MLKANIENILEGELNHSERREILISEMDALISGGKSCHSCSGMCCTYEFNSMKITPLEAVDIAYDLAQKVQVSIEDVKKMLLDNISSFRLDKEFASLGGKNFRRYYTCPFFKDQSLGCSISKELKPYGCIAFNPMHKNVNEPNKCISQVPVLEKRLKKYELEEREKNLKLKEKLKLHWETKPISVAVLEVLEKLDS